jgi:hypothetical protein
MYHFYTFIRFSFSINLILLFESFLHFFMKILNYTHFDLKKNLCFIEKELNLELLGVLIKFYEPLKTNSYLNI